MRGMRKAELLSCPRCTSQKVKLNGHYHKGKSQFYCHSCHKYFYENSAKGYPPTNIPFPVIAYLLYFRKKVPELSNMRAFRKFVSQWLKCVGLKDKDVSRQIIHHWIKNYEKNFQDIISFEEARTYCKELLSKVSKEVPDEVVTSKTLSHKTALQVLKDKFGQKYCFDLIHRDEIFFNELCELASKYEVYCWKLLDKDEMRAPKPFFLARSNKM